MSLTVSASYVTLSTVSDISRLCTQTSVKQGEDIRLSEFPKQGSEAMCPDCAFVCTCHPNKSTVKQKLLFVPSCVCVCVCVVTWVCVPMFANVHAGARVLSLFLETGSLHQNLELTDWLASLANQWALNSDGEILSQEIRKELWPLHAHWQT